MKARLGEKFGCVSRSVNSAFKSPSGRPTVVVTPFTPFLRFRAFHPLTEQKGEQGEHGGKNLLFVPRNSNAHRSIIEEAPQFSDLSP
jgi:hypothetical protein